MQPNHRAKESPERLNADTAGRRIRKAKIEILIHPKPKPTLLPPPNISLLPKHDGTGYIVCRVVLPIGVVLQKDARRTMCYVVGWTDLPAAKVTIPAHEIYDYCSPRVVEDWEYQEYLRKEREEEEDLVKAVERAEKHATGGTVSKQGREVRGRPPRARAQAQLPPEPKLGKEDQELLEKKQASGPSLSTPQKRKLIDYMSEDAYQDDEAAISRQLFGDDVDLDSEAAGQMFSTETGGSEMDESSRASSTLPSAFQLRSLRSSPIRENMRTMGLPERPASAALKALPTPSFHSQDVSRASSVAKIVSRPSKLTGPSTGAGLSGASVAGNVVGSKLQKMSNGARQSLSNDDDGLNVKLPRQSQQANHLVGSNGKRVTPILPPVLPLTGGSAPGSSLAKDKFQQARSYTQTTLIPSKHSTLPSEHKPSDTQQPNLIPVPSSTKISNGTNPATAFTPVSATRQSFLQLHGRKPNTPSVKPTSEAVERSASPNNKPTKKRQKAEQVGDEPEAEIEQQWEVKRLEADRLMKVDGKVMREFRVRWEGDWPPDQNPTWEPEENISSSLVRRYLKKKASRGGDISVPKQKSHTQKTLSSWTKKHSSVQEAFEAGMDNVPAEKAQNFEDDGDTVEQLVVTEDATSNGRPSLPPRDSFDLALARQYASFSKG